jgi:hypothetical protein
MFGSIGADTFTFAQGKCRDRNLQGAVENERLSLRMGNAVIASRADGEGPRNRREKARVYRLAKHAVAVSKARALSSRDLRAGARSALLPWSRSRLLGMTCCVARLQLRRVAEQLGDSLQQTPRSAAIQAAVIEAQSHLCLSPRDELAFAFIPCGNFLTDTQSQ